MPEVIARWFKYFPAGKLTPPQILLFVAAILLLAPQLAHPQETENQLATKSQVKSPESELIAEGEGCFGHFHIYVGSWWSKLYTGGVEYDHHSWDNFVGARMDYVAEALPVALLSEPAKTDAYGDPLTQTKQLVPGVGISPVGLRMMWRSKRSIRPYFITKEGLIIFDKKALSSDATYLNFLLQFGLGVQARLTPRLDLRAGLGYIHFSNAFIVPSNPGLDVMSYNSGLSYHFGK